MRSISPRFAVIIPIILIAAAAIHAAQTHESNPASASASQKTAAQQYKNIQVLKDIPADQLVPAMQYITASLNVECSFCHVEKDFPNDQKPEKKTARKMMTMMFAINKDYFKGEREVTCNTCHNGNAHPSAIPAVMTAEMMEHPQAPHEHGAAPPTITAAEVSDRWIKALGGASAAENAKTYVESGHLQHGTQQIPVTVYAKSPDLRATYAEMPNGAMVTAYDGKSGWLTAHDGAKEMSPSDAYGFRVEDLVLFPRSLDKVFPKTRVLHPEEINGHHDDQVVGLTPGMPPVRFYFDPQSGLLDRIVHYTETPLGQLPVEVDYTDYRDAKGMKVPYKWTIARPGGRFDMVIDKVDANAEIPESKFQKPATQPKSSQ